MLDGNAEAFVLLVLVAADEAADDVHSCLSAIFECFAVKEVSDEDSGEDVACAVEKDGDFFVVDTEVCTFVKVLGEAVERRVAASSDDTWVPVDFGTGDNGRFCS